MSKTRRVLSGFLPFLASMALMYLVTFSVAVCFGILGMKEYQTDYAAVYEQDAQAYITWATAGVHVAYFVVFVFWFYKVRHLSYLERDARKLEFKDYVWMLVLGVTVQIVVSLLLELFLPFFPEVSQSYEELISSMRLGKGFLPFITTSAIAPAAEELIFRGVTMALVGDSVPFAVLNVMLRFCDRASAGCCLQKVSQFKCLYLPSCICKSVCEYRLLFCLNKVCLYLLWLHGTDRYYTEQPHTIQLLIG